MAQILVIDDEVQMRRAFTDALLEKGFHLVDGGHRLEELDFGVAQIGLVEQLLQEEPVVEIRAELCLGISDDLGQARVACGEHVMEIDVIPERAAPADRVGLCRLEEAIVVEFRRRTLLPLDDVLDCLRESIPALSRSALYRCCSDTASRDCPRATRPKPSAAVFAQTTIGYVHIDVCELRCAEGKVRMIQ